MLRIAWYSAKQPGAQPSGTDSFRRAAGSGQGGATGHSHNVAAGYLAILNILELTPSSVPILSPGVPSCKNLPKQFKLVRRSTSTSFDFNDFMPESQSLSSQTVTFCYIHPAKK